MPDEIKEAPGLCILQKMHAVMKACDYIQKDKENSFHRYRYASEAAIKEKLHAELVEHGILPQFQIISTSERTGAGKDGKETVTTAQVAYRFTCVETGQFIEGVFFGQGSDQLDKGIYKATTGAIKYILTSQFLIPTGDDPENAEEKPKPAERKVAQPPKPSPAPNPQPAGWNKFETLAAFRGVKADLHKITSNDEIYYAVLKQNKLEHAKDVKDRATAEKTYRELKLALKSEMTAKGIPA